MLVLAARSRRDLTPFDVLYFCTLATLPEGRPLTELFDAQPCNHSRHCVLDTPSVFKGTLARWRNTGWTGE